MLNKIVKAVGYALSHLLVAVGIYLQALLGTSPLVCLTYGILELLDKTPSWFSGRMLLTWLASGAVVWLVAMIYVELKVHLFRKQAQ